MARFMTYSDAFVLMHVMLTEGLTQALVEFSDF